MRRRQLQAACRLSSGLLTLSHWLTPVTWLRTALLLVKTTRTAPWLVSIPLLVRLQAGQVRASRRQHWPLPMPWGRSLSSFWTPAGPETAYPGDKIVSMSWLHMIICILGLGLWPSPPPKSPGCPWQPADQAVSRWHVMTYPDIVCHKFLLQGHMTPVTSRSAQPPAQLSRSAQLPSNTHTGREMRPNSFAGKRTNIQKYPQQTRSLLQVRPTRLAYQSTRPLVFKALRSMGMWPLNTAQGDPISKHCLNSNYQRPMGCSPQYPR